MKLPDSLLNWLRRVKASFLGTANLLALTIVAWSAFLTWDKYLAAAGVLVELIFLACVTLFRKDRSSSAKPRPKGIDLWLLFVTISGFVVILFFGFGKMLLTPRWLSLSHAQGWEFGAIAWTGLFFTYYTFKFKKTKHPARYQVINSIAVICFITLLIMLYLTMENPVLHVTWVLLAGVCFLILDLVLVFEIDPAQDQDDEINRSLASLVGADVPMVATLTLLLLYLLIYYDADSRDVFVSGVIACQLLFSNAVFVATEFAWLQLPKFEVAKEQATATTPIATDMATQQN